MQHEVDERTDYEVVGSSLSGVALGNVGAKGDILQRLIIVVTNAIASQVQLQDGSLTAQTILPNNVGGGVGVYVREFGTRSTDGAWKVSTAGSVSVIGVGRFT